MSPFQVLIHNLTLHVELCAVELRPACAQPLSGPLTGIRVLGCSGFWSWGFQVQGLGGLGFRGVGAWGSGLRV